ncbi:MAG: polymer-forming cytoskeletal protein [Gammaproteobacteria bacterium]|nr:polymer-forming cytoskeletal protein [Gammaproteobacteria bacterium]
MPRLSTFRLLTVPLLALLLIAPAQAFNVNKSISIAAGRTTEGHSTVNGSISVGSDVVVNGSLQTVNGTIRISDNVTLQDAGTVNGAVRIGIGVRADEITSVNGAIRIGEGAVISDEVSVVNGKIEIASGSTVAGDVSNVNGEITIEGTEIGGDLTTVTGDVLLTDNSLLRGSLIIEKPGGWRWGRKDRKPRIVIGPGSQVVGMIRADQEIELFISDSAEVGGVSGEASLDQAVRFSGERP